MEHQGRNYLGELLYSAMGRTVCDGNSKITSSLMRVLVTGARGFVGKQCLARLLEKGYELHAASTVYQLSTPGCHWHKVDLLESTEVRALFRVVRPSHLLHLAWYTEHDKYWHSHKNLAWVQATLGMMQEFVSAGGRRVVAAGTCAEYDWSHEFYSEYLTPCRPSTLYGAAKHGTQLMLTALAKRAGISAAWGRLFFLYGPGQSLLSLVPSVVRSLLNRQQALCDHGDLVRDYLYVDDAAAALVALLEGEIDGVVNVASGHALQLKDLVSTIADLLDQKDLIHFGKIPLGSREPKQLIADVSRMKSELCFEPEIDMTRGLRLTVDYLKKNLVLT